MEKTQYLLIGISILVTGLVVTLFSNRIAKVMIESTKLLGNEFGIKRTFSRNFEFFVRIILMVFGIIIIMVAVRTFLELF